MTRGDRSKLQTAGSIARRRSRRRSASVRALAGLRAQLRAERADRKRLEIALRTARARYQRLADSNLLGVVLASLDGPILEANDAFLGAIGYDRRDVESGALRWDVITPPEWVPADVRAVEQLVATGVAP